MNNQYLEALHLAPGATKSEIKKAYRHLSKCYHPDVSKDDNAREKFIEINEAYKFLTSVGPRPATISRSAPSYDYDAQNHAYDNWRRKAQKFAQRQAREAVRRQHILTKNLLSSFDKILAAVVVFNLLLFVDSHLPTVQFDDSNSNQILKSSSAFHDILDVNGHTVYLLRGTLDPFRKVKTFESATIYATPILNKPLYLDLRVQGKTYKFEQSAGVFGFFAVIIKAILLVALLYKMMVRTLDLQLSFAILIIFLSVFQLVIFIQY